ncbi:hypothetical protein KAX17_03760 [Candidatus Bipolaricaulota bacterium]|nr:hypothetical protein [Candidatus Bipolaricaulota bacterium]
MLKRMFTLGVAIALAAMLSVVGFSDSYTCNSVGDVKITMTIPEILILDMGASNPVGDITWATITAADLDNKFVVRRAGTSFVVDSNDPQGWTVKASLSGYVGSYWDGVTYDDELNVNSLWLDSDYLQTGSMTSVTVLSEWTQFTQASSQITVAEATVQGKDCVIVVDYKVTLSWLIKPDAYTITVNYTLAGK